jgi:hypothetical protein
MPMTMLVLMVVGSMYTGVVRAVLRFAVQRMGHSPCSSMSTSGRSDWSFRQTVQKNLFDVGRPIEVLTAGIRTYENSEPYSPLSSPAARPSEAPRANGLSHVDDCLGLVGGRILDPRLGRCRRRQQLSLGHPQRVHQLGDRGINAEPVRVNVVWVEVWRLNRGDN